MGPQFIPVAQTQQMSTKVLKNIGEKLKQMN